MKAETNPVERFFKGKQTRSTAINAMCAQCVGCTSPLQGKRHSYHIESGFREAIRECGITGCPLWGFRPYRLKVAA